MVMPQEEVIVKPLEIVIVNDNFEDGFRKFKSLVQKDGVLLVYREKQRFEKASDKKRRKEREMLEHNLMLAAREKEIISGEFEAKLKKKEIKRKQKAALRAAQRASENSQE